MKTKRNPNWIWGIFFLLAAVGLVANQFGVFSPLNFWAIIAALCAVGCLSSMIANRTISTLPFVVAFAYLALRNLELVPHVAAWVVFVAAGLTSAGLAILIPQRMSKNAKFAVGTFTDWEDCDWDEGDWDEETREEHRKRAQREMGGIDNNPSVSVTFGTVSRYLHADKLETVKLFCNFGAMDIYFDQAELHPDGATVHVSCNFGGIDIYVPRHWQVREDIRCVFGGADVNNSRLACPGENAPQLTISGNVTFGGVDIWYI